MRLQPILCLMITMMSSACVSETLPNNFPEALTYHDKPIDPLCFTENEPSNNQSLDKCGAQFSSELEIIDKDQKLIDSGYIGYEYNWSDKTDPAIQSRGYSYYKVIGYFNHRYTVYALNNGGGTGHFTSLNLVTRKNDTLHVAPIVMGDRCNGGVSSPSQKNHTLSFSIHITAYDLLTLTQQNPNHLRAYDDLDACASCCIGVATYDLNLVNKKEKMKLVSVTFDKGIDLTLANNNTNDNHQSCLNQLIGASIKSGKRSFSPKELNSLINKFNHLCTQ